MAEQPEPPVPDPTPEPPAPEPVSVAAEPAGLPTPNAGNAGRRPGLPGGSAVLGLVVLAVGLAGGWFLGRRPRTPPLAPLSTTIAAAERQVAPAVVQIDVEVPRRTPRGRFRLPPGLELGPPRPRIEHNLGSGLIVDPRGYIVTNRHVVNRAQRIVVTVPGDQRTYYARLIGVDEETDLGLIKINAGHALPVARWGDSGRLAVGDWVLAIGSPFGLEDSVTAGIVSALHRAMDPDQQFESFIQTDAPINPGNSGGPLVDLSGAVVGINTAIYTDSDGSQGVGFALPSQLVGHIYPQLLRQGHVTRGSIGIYFENTIDPAVRRVYHLAQGVPVSQVADPGPAASAGLRAGDVITSLNGIPTTDGDALMNAVEFAPIGRALRVGYLRSGVARVAAVRVEDRAQIYPDQSVPRPVASPPPPRLPDFGLNLETVPGQAGAQVQAVAPDSFGDDIGVHEDDVLLEINHQPIASPAAFARLSAALADGADVALVVRRPNGDGTDSRWLLGGTLPPAPR